MLLTGGAAVWRSAAGPETLGNVRVHHGIKYVHCNTKEYL